MGGYPYLVMSELKKFWVIETSVYLGNGYDLILAELARLGYVEDAKPSNWENMSKAQRKKWGKSTPQRSS